MFHKITIILGPTGVGKTQYALDLARKSGAEIISADAFQVYRGMDIGTDKISRQIRTEISHHLIDIQSPDTPYSVADFIQRTTIIIRGLSQAKIPIIICGGTAFYLHAFLYGYSLRTEKPSPEILQQLESELARFGQIEMWERLRQLDPESATQIHPNNTRRVLRALTIARQTGQKPSELRTRSHEPRTDCTIIGLNAPRDTLYAKINARVVRMFESGWVNEVRQLLDQGYSPDCPGFQAIGYREIAQHLQDDIPIEKVIESIQQRTRHFAKRQLTWYNQFDHVTWIES